MKKNRDISKFWALKQNVLERSFPVILKMTLREKKIKTIRSRDIGSL
jgi:hypothetical protein